MRLFKQLSTTKIIEKTGHSFVEEKSMLNCMPLWSVLGLVICLSMTGCAGTHRSANGWKSGSASENY